MMKYISPGSWFSLELPAGWHEFEDAEDSFLFYNPEKWSGNFRISAYRGESNSYAKDCIVEELKQTDGAKRIQVGTWSCAYMVESFQEDGVWYTSHIWITGHESVSIECSFTVARGESIKVAEDVIASLRVRGAEEKPWKEVIPVRVLEINMINEYYDWAVSSIKKQLTKDFTASEADVASIQKVIESGRYNKNQRQTWESFGIAFGSILVNEMDGMNWVTVIDGAKEFPALRFADTQVMVYPTELIWSKIKKGLPCNLKAEYAQIKSEVESVI